MLGSSLGVALQNHQQEEYCGYHADTCQIYKEKSFISKTTINMKVPRGKWLQKVQ